MRLRVRIYQFSKATPMTVWYRNRVGAAFSVNTEIKGNHKIDKKKFYRVESENKFFNDKLILKSDCCDVTDFKK